MKPRAITGAGLARAENQAARARPQGPELTLSAASNLRSPWAWRRVAGLLRPMIQHQASSWVLLSGPSVELHSPGSALCSSDGAPGKPQCYRGPRHKHGGLGGANQHCHLVYLHSSKATSSWTQAAQWVVLIDQTSSTVSV